MATRKKTAKPAARKSGRTAAKRAVSAKARKPAAARSLSSRRAPAPQPAWSFTRMLADIFGMR